MPRIDELWAWVSSDDEGEGILAAPLAIPENKDGKMLSVPLVGADRDRMLSYEPMARQMADIFGVEVRLIRLTNRTDVETISPKVSEHSDLPPTQSPFVQDVPDSVRRRTRETVHLPEEN